MAKTPAARVLDETMATLRLRGHLRTSIELMPLIRRGLPGASLVGVSDKLDLSVQATAQHLRLAKRTVARGLQKGHRLDAEESERVVRLARALAEATEVLGSLAKARRWLQTPNRALGGEVPVRLLDTDVGSNAVLEELGRIEHGV